jgi:murein DD-endopeptidase MepM/ murein hydrolase activator NlpD
MAHRRINLMIMREGQTEEAVRSYSLPGYLPRLAIIIGVLLVLLLTVATIVIFFFWHSALEAGSLRAENESLRRSVARVAQLETELEQHRRFTRRVADMIGIDVPSFPDSALHPSGQPIAAGTGDTDSIDMSSLAPTEATPRAAGVLVADCLPDPNNRPRGLPVRGRVSRGFQPAAVNPALRHQGIDIAVREGSPVYAPAAGVVVYAGQDDVFGLMLTVDHGGGFKTVYGHNSELKMKIGDKVVRGDIIARSGNTGASTAPHLHYEIQRDDRPVDPAAFLGHSD